MDRFSDQATRALQALDRMHDDAGVTPQVKLFEAAQAACILLELFLRIHPYANGNGHMARAIVIALLARYNYRVRNWTVDPRPDYPVPYVRMILAQRSGDPFTCPAEILKLMM
jgi:fido (protein-threonine AMPylation protein)